MMKNEIAKFPEMADYAKRLRREGKSFRAISAALGVKGLGVSHQAVKNYFDNADALGAVTIQRDQLIREEVKKDILETTKHIKKVGQKLWEICERLEDSGDKDKDFKLLAVMDRLIKQLDVSSRIMGRLAGYNKTQVTQNFSFLDFSIKVSDYIEKLEKLGFIKIVKPIEMEGDVRDGFKMSKGNGFEVSSVPEVVQGDSETGRERSEAGKSGNDVSELRPDGAPIQP